MFACVYARTLTTTQCMLAYVFLAQYSNVAQADLDLMVLLTHPLEYGIAGLCLSTYPPASSSSTGLQVCATFPSSASLC